MQIQTICEMQKKIVKSCNNEDLWAGFHNTTEHSASTI